MQGEAASVRSRFLEYELLDPEALELDVDAGTVADGLQYGIEPGDGRAAANVEASDHVPRRLGDEMPTDFVVVMYYHDAIRCGVHIEFDRVCTVLERAKEAGEGVFDAFARRPAVRNALETRGGLGGGFRHTVVLFRNPPHGKRLTLRATQRLLYGRMTEPVRSVDEPQDAELIARWKAGDQRAARKLVERHASALARFAVSCGARDEIDELVQDTFVRAFGSLDGFRGESSFRTWLFTIERRLLMDRRRAEGRRPISLEIAEEDVSTEYDALDEMVADEAQAHVRRAIERLTPMQREVFVLRVSEGLSYKEIAEAVGSTEGAARVHYHNAMRAVKEFLDA